MHKAAQNRVYCRGFVCFFGFYIKDWHTNARPQHMTAQAVVWSVRSQRQVCDRRHEMAAHGSGSLGLLTPMSPPRQHYYS